MDGDGRFKGVGGKTFRRRDDIFTVMSKIIGLYPPMTIEGGGGDHLAHDCTSLEHRAKYRALKKTRGADVPNYHYQFTRCFMPNNPSYMLNTREFEADMENFRWALQFVVTETFVWGLTGPVGGQTSVWRGLNRLRGMSVGSVNITGARHINQLQKASADADKAYKKWKKAQRDLQTAKKAARSKSTNTADHTARVKKLEANAKKQYDNYKTKTEVFNDKATISITKTEAREAAREAKMLSKMEKKLKLKPGELDDLKTPIRPPKGDILRAEMSSFERAAILRARLMDQTEDLSRAAKASNILQEQGRVSVAYKAWQMVFGKYSGRYMDSAKTGHRIQAAMQSGTGSALTSGISPYRYLLDGVVFEHSLGRFLHRYPKFKKALEDLFNWRMIGHGMANLVGLYPSAKALARYRAAGAAAGSDSRVVANLEARATAAAKAWTFLFVAYEAIKGCQNPKLARVLVMPQVESKLDALEETGQLHSVRRLDDKDTRVQFIEMITNKWSGGEGPSAAEQTELVIKMAEHIGPVLEDKLNIELEEVMINWEGYMLTEQGHSDLIQIIETIKGQEEAAAAESERQRAPIDLKGAGEQMSVDWDMTDETRPRPGPWPPEEEEE